jgi:hypothetical protein
MVFVSGPLTFRLVLPGCLARPVAMIAERILAAACIIV